MTRPPRAVRNANPGNIEAGTIPWVGLIDPSQMDADQRAEQRFCVFSEPKYGFRALAITLLTYWHRYGLCSVNDIITRYAPSKDNNTPAYMKAVCDSVGADKNKALDLLNADTLKSLCRAIAVHESGGWFFQQQDLDAGVDMAMKRS